MSTRTSSSYTELTVIVETDDAQGLAHEEARQAADEHVQSERRAGHWEYVDTQLLNYNKFAVRYQ